MAHAVVVGAGFGGMAAALRLRARGYDVTLLEKQKQLGGRAMVIRRDGFTFDMGPTVITAPFLLDELFALFGRKREDYVNFVPLYPWYRIQFHDGRFFDYGGTIEQTLEQIRKFNPGDCDGYLRFLEHSKRIFDIGFVELGDKPFLDIFSMIKVAPQMAMLGAWRTVWQMAGKYIKDDLLRRVFSFQPLLVGGNPFNTTSVYCLIHYLEREYGVHFAMGGTGAIVAALRRLLQEQSVTIRTGVEVNEIKITSGHVSTVHSRDGAIDCDVLVCNADAPFVYHTLLRRPDVVKRFEYSMGLFVLYFGTMRKYPDVQHHTIILGEQYESLLHDMFDLKRLEMSDLSVYLHRPTATDPSMAPEGCDCFYALVPVPNLQSGIDWKAMGPNYQELVINYLEKKALPGLRECMRSVSYVTPEYHRDELNALHGTGFSIQPTLGQSAFLRFHNKSDDIDNLFFVGAGTHPGAGLPGVLCSAKVLDRIIPSPQGQSVRPK
jgi:phytoene desaturase